MEKKIIGIKQVLEMLENGKTRKEIGAHYGITNTELTQLFKHKDLFGKKTKPKPSFIIVDDEEGTTQNSALTEAKEEAPFELEEGPMATPEAPARTVATPSWEN